MRQREGDPDNVETMGQRKYFITKEDRERPWNSFPLRKETLEGGWVSLCAPDGQPSIRWQSYLSEEEEEE